ncbi:hypothetical protein [Vibrio coralliilyticus]|uniref:hypothetical protein n=1 Tax=Vibrio coralliilyticus TaxID=190893 RepID=UPI00114765B0|nr:hypothetical protein [Vibrio coralliilyticus]NRF32997.1 hypothetical protein [Vibrio coralliilyticus]NRF55497.1 hypothetical protein [Vibrio coralliilyticus]QIJ87725.1 hypothetical protein G3U99_25965 [Vibrio coralliilyticus OCN008]
MSELGRDAVLSTKKHGEMDFSYMHLSLYLMPSRVSGSDDEQQFCLPAPIYGHPLALRRQLFFPDRLPRPFDD